MIPTETTIHIGGLLRCCLADIAEQLDAVGMIRALDTVETGDRLVTSCCGEMVVLDGDGVWRWEKR